ncbi:hypothetical protein R5H30_06140 [Sulfitobacter sp. D35]|uniref:hypothetical protein n=1 Tax=Sulfitobacter sp. D35 TaxID=3083252 RepID=UPI00296EA4A3|nr:hypothetical protein [Sulfitobacter sp. D35]MDW4497554.1 hypothetical protein [Sulfitobacter sp. D35]
MKMSTLIAAAVCCGFAGTSALAQASDVLPVEGSTFTEWGTEGDWRIYLDETKGSCFAERTDAEQDVLQMGLTKAGDLGYLGVFTLGDSSGGVREQRINVSLDGKEYQGTGYSGGNHLSKNHVGGYILTNNPRLVEDVMNTSQMDVTPQLGKPFSISLAGTQMAIEAARKCTSEQGG